VTVKIANLSEYQQFIPELARLHQAEFGYLSPQSSEASRAEKLRGTCRDEDLPVFFVAVDKSGLIGSAGLVIEDMRTKKDLTPWLAGVYVKAEHRNKGIATALVAKVENEAKLRKVDTLYLFTPSAAALYGKLGWSMLERCQYMGTQVDVMFKRLAT